MTKKELVDKVQEIYSQVTNCIDSVKILKTELEGVLSLLEDIPEEEKEFFEETEKSEK